MWMFSTRSGRDKGGWEKIKIFSMSLQSFETTRRRFRTTEKKTLIQRQSIFSPIIKRDATVGVSDFSSAMSRRILLLFFLMIQLIFSMARFNYRSHPAVRNSKENVDEIVSNFNWVVLSCAREAEFRYEFRLIYIVPLEGEIANLCNIRGSSGKKWVMCAMHIKAGYFCYITRWECEQNEAFKGWIIKRLFSKCSGITNWSGWQNFGIKWT